MINALKKEQGRELSSFDNTMKEAQAELKRQGTNFKYFLNDFCKNKYF